MFRHTLGISCCSWCNLNDRSRHSRQTRFLAPSFVPSLLVCWWLVQLMAGTLTDGNFLNFGVSNMPNNNNFTSCWLLVTDLQPCVLSSRLSWNVRHLYVVLCLSSRLHIPINTLFTFCLIIYELSTPFHWLQSVCSSSLVHVLANRSRQIEWWCSILFQQQAKVSLREEDILLKYTESKHWFMHIHIW